MMDVDFFKRYNDHYGHSAGDEALRGVSRVIGAQARRPLDMTARYGGEEFVGLWYGLDEAAVMKILEQLRAEVEALGLAHAKSDIAPVVTLSIGLAWLVPEPHQRLADALRLADVALYLAKEQGRNRVVGKRPGSSQVA
jgi:diguanylate cyclase (GGDEF)-like protein